MSSGIFLPRSHVTRRKVAALNNQGKRNLGGRAHKQRFPRVRKLHGTEDSILASCLVAQGSFLSVPKIFSEFLDVAEIYRQQCTVKRVDSAKILNS